MSEFLDFHSASTHPTIRSHITETSLAPRRARCETRSRALPLHGPRTVIYPAADLDAAKIWWSALLGSAPYFDEPFYVGFNVGGYELSLLPDANPGEGALVY
jgi:hypothetical protein